MLASLFAGVAGLRNHQTRMNVIGNNVSNINTIGYKAARSIFQEALVQTLRSAARPSAVSGGTNPVQLGLGINVASIDNIFTQGGLEVTGNITDLAIQGNGFFILSDGTQKYYTRAGAFGFDANSYLVNPSNGLYVQGKMADASGDIPSTATVGSIRLPFGQQDPARATSLVELGNNLDADATRSTASITEGTTPTCGVNSVTGVARDGAGGTHYITVTGDQATQANASGTGAGLTGSERLGDLGVTEFGLTLSVDGGADITVGGLTDNSTIDELLRALDSIDGVDAELDSSGTLQIYRSKAGASYSVESNPTVAGDIMNTLFGVAAGSALTVNNGLDHTFVAVDEFAPSSDESITVTKELEIVVSNATGLATGIAGLGDGGVTISTGDGGLQAGDVSITTADTEKSTSITVYDTLGGKHTMMTNFIKSYEPNKWYWEISMTGGEEVQSGYTGTISFQNNGALAEFKLDGGATAFTFDPNNGAGISEIELFAGTIGQFDGVTGFSGTETMAALSQDGYGMGILEKISIDPTGLIIGKFSNGVSRNLAQILLADFNNEGGLTKVGNSLYTTSANSGAGIEGVAGETVSATISSGALESANVDLAQEFTSMIIAQRGFQSNARVITTSDSMLDDLVNLKR
jgi:flagellar hook protein FlgE